MTAAGTSALGGRRPPFDLLNRRGTTEKSRFVDGPAGTMGQASAPPGGTPGTGRCNMMNKIARLSLAAGLAAVSAASADYTGLTVESYVGEGWVENGFADLTAWRIYALFDDPDDLLIAVFGSPQNPLTVASTAGAFRNDPLHDSLLAPDNWTGPPHFYWANQWDTYVTIGLDDGAYNNTWVSEGLAIETGNLAGTFTSGNLCWYVPPPQTQGLPGPDGRVLVGQFVVVVGEHISGVLNLQFEGGAQALDQPFQSPDPCPEDLNNDGVVNVLDLLQALAAWGPCPACIEDLNGDGVVNVEDLLLVLAAWGPCP
jgi:hypothetical protein